MLVLDGSYNLASYGRNENISWNGLPVLIPNWFSYLSLSPPAEKVIHSCPRWFHQMNCSRMSETTILPSKDKWINNNRSYPHCLLLKFRHDKAGNVRWYNISRTIRIWWVDFLRPLLKRKIQIIQEAKNEFIYDCTIDTMLSAYLIYGIPDYGILAQLYAMRADDNQTVKWCPANKFASKSWHLETYDTRWITQTVARECIKIIHKCSVIRCCSDEKGKNLKGCLNI